MSLFAPFRPNWRARVTKSETLARQNGTGA